jgi:hypothetical protein
MKHQLIFNDITKIDHQYIFNDIKKMDHQLICSDIKKIDHILIFNDNRKMDHQLVHLETWTINSYFMIFKQMDRQFIFMIMEKNGPSKNCPLIDIQMDNPLVHSKN